MKNQGLIEFQASNWADLWAFLVKEMGMDPLDYDLSSLEAAKEFIRGLEGAKAVKFEFSKPSQIEEILTKLGNIESMLEGGFHIELKMAREGWVSSDERLPDNSSDYNPWVEVMGHGECFYSYRSDGRWITAIESPYSVPAAHTYWREIR